jgi:hypothetical protein
MRARDVSLQWAAGVLLWVIGLLLAGIKKGSLKYL